jgi:hypothetical protein
MAGNSVTSAPIRPPARQQSAGAPLGLPLRPTGCSALFARATPAYSRGSGAGFRTRPGFRVRRPGAPPWPLVYTKALRISSVTWLFHRQPAPLLHADWPPARVRMLPGLLVRRARRAGSREGGLPSLALPSRTRFLEAFRGFRNLLPYHSIYRSLYFCSSGAGVLQ